MALTKQQQQQLVVVVMVTVGFLYVYWNYMMKPTNEKIARLSGEVGEILGQVETMKRTANRLPALQREYDSLVAEVGQTEKRLPKQKNIEEVLRLVTEHAAKNQIRVASFAPGGERAQNYYVELPISLTITGSFNTLAKFLAVMGQQERILSARNLTLTYSPNPKKGQTVGGSFSLMAYMFKG